MKSEMLPFNISLLVPTKEQLKTIRPVTTLDIFDGPGGNFHDDGLFSTLTFARVGDPMRDRRFGYIDLHIPIMHPVMFSRLIKLKSLYKGILSGQQYAVWDASAEDFVEADALTGQTGYAFFVSYWEQLNPKPTGSSSRDLRIGLLNKYRDDAFLSQLLVMPAGLREADIDTDGRVSMDEINELYQSVLMTRRSIPERLGRNDDLSVYDRTRYTLTMQILAIFEYIERLISGKGGFIQSRWASRRVFNGTRNVLSSLDPSAVDLDAPNRPKMNDTVIGLYQASKAILPKTIYGLKTSVVADIFATTNNQVQLVNPKTLKSVWVEISNADMDRWGTDEGLEQVINDLATTDKRDRPVMVAEHYLALVYVDDQDNYRILRSVDEVPEGFDTKWVRPITYAELIYLSGLSFWYRTAGFVVRYPIENYNSSIPTKAYVKTTVVGELRYPLDAAFQRDPDGALALEYPVFQPGVKSQYHDSISVPAPYLKSLGADFDGDTVSFNATYSDEAVEEADRFFKTRRAYIQTGGGLAFSVNVATLKLALSYMSGDPE